MPGISTREQRLAWQHDEQTASLYRDPTLDELLEHADETGRHHDFDLTSQGSILLSGRSAGHPRIDEGLRAGAHILTRPTAAPAAKVAPIAAAPPVGGEARPPAIPPERAGLANSSPNWELYVWQPTP